MIPDDTELMSEKNPKHSSSPCFIRWLLHFPHCLNACLLMPVSLPVSLSHTQFDAMLIRLLLISRIVLPPQTSEMYTPFNLFCLSGVVAWMPDKKWIVFPSLQLDAISMSLV